MLKQLLTLFFILLLTGCSDDESPENKAATESFCANQELEVRSDGNSCDVGSLIDLCVAIEVEETQYIDSEAYDWIPDICDFEVGDQITFKNGTNSTFWTAVDRGHYIAKERISGSCDDHWHDTAFICQENEVIQVSFVNDLLGIQDTLQLQLRTKIIETVDGEPGEKRNVVGLWQDRAFTNIANFWINHYVGNEYYEQTWQSYNESVILNGKEYRDVLKYEYGDHIHDEPHHRFYMEYDKGILAFEVDGKLWVRDE